MQEEIENAVAFICKFLLREINQEEIQNFKNNLTEILNSYYRDHWFPQRPCRGSAYRCIRITPAKMDPLLTTAVSKSSLTVADLHRLLPNEFTIWIDPKEVSCRFGEEGSVGTVYEEQNSVSPTSRIQNFYSTCRQQMNDLIQSTTSQSSDRIVSLDCLKSFLMV